MTRIIDDDTVEVRQDSRAETVRGVGIDTPERSECGFGEASAALTDLVLGEPVTLVAGARATGTANRILRYLDVGDLDAGLALAPAARDATAPRLASTARRPVRRGDAGYGPHLDRDGDGVGCE